MKLKLLIVDDESYTREGLYKSLPWGDIGIGDVWQADDGLSALKILKEHNPDILVTDIRMPGMDGVELARQVRQRLPACKIIFMTAYSDKEYLKSAINLKVSSYVEKPIDLGEMEQAVRQAACECIGEAENKIKVAQMTSTYHYSMSILRKDLVLELSRMPESEGFYEWLKYTAPEFSNEYFFATILFSLKLKNGDGSAGQAQMLEARVRQTMDECASSFGLHSLSDFKDADMVITHISFEVEQHNLQRELLGNYVSTVICTLSDEVETFASIGEIVRSVSQIYKSYRLAVLGLQTLFFSGYNRWTYATTDSYSIYIFKMELQDKFSVLLDNRNYEEISAFLISTIEDIKLHKGTLPDNARDFIFKWLRQVLKASEENNIELFSSEGGNIAAWDYVHKAKTLDELGTFPLEKVRMLFDIFEERNKYSKVILEIMKYIKANYSNSNLSVQSISDYFFMNKAYLCTLFKKETGITINQCIINYRIKMAKALLNDNQNKLINVTSQVGFTDPNYFTKIFKKLEGMTPSDYRSRTTSE